MGFGSRFLHGTDDCLPGEPVPIASDPPGISGGS
jgi:hypothetical protein